MNKEQKLIKKMKEDLKKDSVVKNMFKENDVSIQELDNIPMMFKKLDVSAKCDHGVIYFNKSLVEEGLEKNYSYAVHELTHFFQQCFGDEPTKGSNAGEYLDNKFEQEGFKNQVEFISKELGKNKAEKYVDHLLDYHEIDENELKEKKDILMSKV